MEKGALEEFGDNREWVERGLEIKILVRTGRTVDTTWRTLAFIKKVFKQRKEKDSCLAKVVIF